MTYCQQLIEFLTARLDEDEELAKAATIYDPQWLPGEFRTPETARPGVDEGTHIARHDPARVLLDVESKRQLVAYCGQLIADADADSTYEGTTAAANVAEEVLELLVLPYAGHPDCDPEWLA